MILLVLVFSLGSSLFLAFVLALLRASLVKTRLKRCRLQSQLKANLHRLQYSGKRVRSRACHDWVWFLFCDKVARVV